ncbi:hypothetical protein BJX63DRAFT_437861 [Aspergillus granulosus]|uniref:NADH:flavin oxidoreductase/NADH oxidase N-terminal domain-containing protein n=1 Tax=Aspergillus granulosus TaxID=176169 RepID=A0ABR4GTP6_9EURO
MGRAAKPFLFVHSSGPTHVYRRDEQVKTDIRRHIMVGIGKARRKPLRNPKIDVLMQPLSDREGHHLESEKARRDRLPNETIMDGQLPGSPRFPFWDQNPLVVLERCWGMDMFSAYGIAFVVNEGRRRTTKGDVAGGFWFPFAFRASEFLRHFRHILTSPEMLAAVAHVSEKKFQAIALERSTGTIACIEAKLATRDTGITTANNVIRGVLASICYNFVCADFSHASVHLTGLEQLIAARGGIDSLQDDSDLRLMIFWVDIIASLICAWKPRFPIPSDLIPDLPLLPQIDILALPLRYLANQPNSVPDKYTTAVLYCLRDLWRAATYIESNIPPRDSHLWAHEESVGLRLNPITHRLLSLSAPSGLASHHTPIARALRLGQIVWIILVKRRFQSYPGSAAVYASNLLRLLSDRRAWAGDAGLPSVRLWLLVLCGMGLSQNGRNILRAALARWSHFGSEFDQGGKGVFFDNRDLPGSPVPFGGEGGVEEYVDSHAITLDDIHDVVSQFARAAKLAIEIAGFDGVEIHGANEYLLDSFVHDNINMRTDDYGGSFENRLRFPLEVVDAVIDAIGAGRTAIRLAPFHILQETRDRDRISTFSALSAELEKRALAEGQDQDQEKDSGEAVSIWPFRRVLKNTTVIGAGGYDAVSAAKAIEEGRIDLAAFRRYFTSNPDLPDRLFKGLPLPKYHRPTFYTPGEEGYLGWLRRSES